MLVVDLIFVANITNHIRGEKIVMWRNFSFPCMTIVGKLKNSPHVKKFQYNWLGFITNFAVLLLNLLFTRCFVVKFLPQVTRFHVEKNWAEKYICAEKMTNIRSGWSSEVNNVLNRNDLFLNVNYTPPKILITSLSKSLLTTKGHQNFWSIVPDDLWSKKICRLKMIFFYHRCYLHLGWSCFQLSRTTQ